MARKPTSREFLLLGVLATAVIIALWLRGGGGFNLGGDDAAQKTEGPLVGDSPRVRMERLSQPVESYDPKGRNLFAYWTPPPPKPPVLPPRPTPKPVAKPPVTRNPTPPPPRDRTPKGPRPPVIAFDYLGYLGPKDDKIAVFEHGDEIMLARQGEVVQRHFKVVGFGYETVMMGYTDDRFKDMKTELPRKTAK